MSKGQVFDFGLRYRTVNLLTSDLSPLTSGQQAAQRSAVFYQSVGTGKSLDARNQRSRKKSIAPGNKFGIDRQARLELKAGFGAFISQILQSRPGGFGVDEIRC